MSTGFASVFHDLVRGDLTCSKTFSSSIRYSLLRIVVIIFHIIMLSLDESYIEGVTRAVFDHLIRHRRLKGDMT
jgi:hypothetical protein